MSDASEIAALRRHIQNVETRVAELERPGQERIAALEDALRELIPIAESVGCTADEAVADARAALGGE